MSKEKKNGELPRLYLIIALVSLLVIFFFSCPVSTSFVCFYFFSVMSV